MSDVTQRRCHRFGGSETQGARMTLTQSDKWLRQAGVLDTWSLTTIDTALAFRWGIGGMVNVKIVLQEDIARLHLS